MQHPTGNHRTTRRLFVQPAHNPAIDSSKDRDGDKTLYGEIVDKQQQVKKSKHNGLNGVSAGKTKGRA